MSAEFEALLAGTRVIPVITLRWASAASPLAEALSEAGVTCAEVTLRTPASEDALRVMARHPDLVVGAGTVLDVAQAERAVAAGARFVVSPGLDADIAVRCRALGVPYLPGTATAGELMLARRLGQTAVKLFPAEQLGGLDLLGALAAPFPQARFVPTGGISPERMPQYLAHPSVLAVGGSWITPPDLLERGDFDGIRRLAAQAVERSRT
jgi:2-dehydro-3-deoxyphosphogluconate aldolase/(4S)-4-hydroxy-2-oxoglutarate aldolase